jgi:hypothetical protein
MSRRFTLEEYLEGFVDEHTESAEEEMKLLVTDAQVHTVGLFFIEGMVGLIKCLRSERATPLSHGTKADEKDGITDEVTTDGDDFVN